MYRLGVVGTGTLSHDLKRWYYRTRGWEDQYLKIDESDRGLIPNPEIPEFRGGFVARKAISVLFVKSVRERVLFWRPDTRNA